MGENKISFLRNCELYEGLSDEEICSVAQSSVNRNYTKGELIYTPHTPAPNIYIVKKGEVQLYHSIDGKKIVFDILTPGSVFGCFQMEQSLPNHFAECSKPGYLCTTPINEFLQLVQVYPEITLRLMQKMAHRLNEYETKLEASSGDAATKILYELKRIQEKRSRNFFGKIFSLPLRMTHEEIAHLTGLNRVTVTRTMQELIHMGKISIDSSSGGITIQV